MIWWWMPFMGMLQPAEPRDWRENDKVTADQSHNRDRPRAKTRRHETKTKRKAASKTVRKAALKSAGQKSVTRKTSSRTRSKRR
jgi:hypothetical protein